MHEINSFKGMDNIEFDMEDLRVYDLLGSPTQAGSLINNEKTDRWGNLEVDFFESRVRSISVCGDTNFLIDGHEVNFQDIRNNKFLLMSNPYLVDGIYVFPVHGICVYGLDHMKDGFEIRAYSKSHRIIFEENIESMPRYLDLLKTESKKIAYDIKPFKEIGPLRFGMTQDIVKSILGHPKKITRMMGELFEERPNLLIVYNKLGELDQVSIEDVENVTLDGNKIFTHGDDLPVLTKEEYLKNRQYFVFFKFGIALRKSNNGSGVEKIVVFSEKRQQNWRNIHRPIFS